MPLSADDIEQIGRLMDDRMENCAFKGAERAIKVHQENCEAPKTIKQCRRYAGAAVITVLAFVVRELYNRLWG